MTNNNVFYLPAAPASSGGSGQAFWNVKPLPFCRRRQPSASHVPVITATVLCMYLVGWQVLRRDSCHACLRDLGWMSACLHYGLTLFILSLLLWSGTTWQRLCHFFVRAWQLGCALYFLHSYRTVCCVPLPFLSFLLLCPSLPPYLSLLHATLHYMSLFIYVLYSILNNME